MTKTHGAMLTAENKKLEQAGLYRRETIHPGHVGVSVKKCGGGGVSSNPIPTGYYWRSLFCEDVVEYPTNVQTLVLAKSPHEGRAVLETLRASTCPHLELSLMVSQRLQVNRSLLSRCRIE